MKWLSLFGLNSIVRLERSAELHFNFASSVGTLKTSTLEIMHVFHTLSEKFYKSTANLSRCSSFVLNYILCFSRFTKLVGDDVGMEHRNG